MKKTLFLILASNFIFNSYCMEDLEEKKEECLLVSHEEKIFEPFTDLDPELQIYALSILLFDIVKSNSKCVKALKKALSAIDRIKRVNHKFYNYRKDLFARLKDIMAQKFVSAEIMSLDQIQKNDLLENCLSSPNILTHTVCHTKSEIVEFHKKLEEYKIDLVEYILGGADPEIIISHIINTYKDGKACSKLNTNTLSQPLFLAMCYGAKLDNIPENLDPNQEIDVKTFIISWAIENVTDKLLSVIKCILKSKLDPNTKLYRRGGDWKLLHIAAYNLSSRFLSKLKLVQLLLQFGAKKDLRTQPEGKNEKGHTPYDLAKIAGNEEILDILRIEDNLPKENRCLVS